MRVNGKLIGSHVVSYTLAYGPVPDGLDVLHSCDNPPCGNPAHLFSGTHKQNLADAMRKGRMTGAKVPLRGEQAGFRKLTESLVRAIRLDAANGTSHRILAARYGISGANISYIVTRKTWGHVA